MKLDHFTLAYIQAALWSTNDESNESGGEPLDSNYSIEDIAPDTMAKIVADCARFQELHGALFVMKNIRRPTGDAGSCSEMAGHDFWLTRCGHGAGFWDGDWEEPAATILTDSAKEFGEIDIYVGGDKKLHI